TASPMFFETAGAFQLSAITQPWWDLRTSRLQTAEGKGVSVSVSAAPVAKPKGTSLGEAAFWREPSNWLKIVILLAGIAAGLWVIARGAGWSGAAWAVHRGRWGQSEAYAFDDLIAVCRTGDLRATYRAFALWRSRLPAGAAASAAPLAAEVEKALFSDDKGSAKWSSDHSRALAEELRQARRSLIQENARVGASTLPP